MHLTLTPLSTRFSPALSRTLAATAALLTLAAAAAAQPETFDEPRFITVTDSTELRCAPGVIWYPVATLEPGTVLQADAVDGEWLRVAYPENTPAVILGRNARLDEQANTVILTRRTGLRAFNMNYPGVDTSFKRLLNEDLPAVGTAFDYLGPINDASGAPTAFKVEAPPNAKGFVLRDATRPATDAEINQPAPADDTQPQPQPQPTQTPDDASDTAPDTPTPTTPEGTPSDTPDRTPSDDTTNDPQPDTTDTTDTDVPDTTMGEPTDASEDTTQPDTDRATRPNAPTLSPADARRRVARIFDRLTALDNRFEQVRAQNAGQSEVNPLIAEYRRVTDEAANTAIADQVAQHTESRIALLELRAEVLDAVREVEQAAQLAERVAVTIEELAQRAGTRISYDAVGTLLPSGVYTGEAGLPLLYRVQGGEGARARTLAYIAPTDQVTREALRQLTGFRVGVVGELAGSQGVAVDVYNAIRLEALEDPDANNN